MLDFQEFRHLTGQQFLGSRALHLHDHVQEGAILGAIGGKAQDLAPAPAQHSEHANQRTLRRSEMHLN